MTARFLSLFGLLLALVAAAPAFAQGVVYEGGTGPGKGKHVVLVSGDEEYRSEEACPQLGKILSQHHGFKCTVLFAIDPKDGSINPNVSNIPGLEALASADLLIIFTRFRDLPDEQMKLLADFIESGKPIIGLRTSTHAFNIKGGKTYARYSFNSNDKDYSQGFGRQVLGETWINHHGAHGKQATRGILPKDVKHPILTGIKDGDIFGPTDVYGVRLPLPGDSQPLVLGQVVEGMNFEDKPLAGPKNDPMMPVAWVKSYTGAAGKKARVFNTTMGASQDLLYAGTRRMLVNAAYWCVGLEDQIKADSKIDIVGKYEPLPFKFNGFKPGVKPEAHKLD